MKTRRFFAGLGIATSIATAGTLLPAATPAAEARTNYWAAIAWDYNGKTAKAWNYPSSAAARNAAKRLCGSHCGYFTFYRSCGAVAYRFGYSRTTVGTARGFQTRAGAKRAAMRQAGAGSHIRASVCNK
ncbi:MULTISPECIES: DUF4189 domain-containing protein [unclassified Gordonia (in: high G+C Gram-positive bacteria)]|uniref:DUF4189 domain-containing protein n=1 Tax=unclassified Gordonia (in: high G+C Gram-positive bacteria) TaxID=2657482 RepID=UPI00200019D8|nr:MULTISPECIES: DUF4189 domain-containing protein [unclassified Gordonia (in: high G+C Gram-positive bacteria)]UQE73819.1 DUF4189 domain-containing protein [Gordonia sp. PP30]